MREKDRPAVELRPVQRLLEHRRDGVRGELHEDRAARAERHDRRSRGQHFAHVVGEEVFGAEEKMRRVVRPCAQLVEEPLQLRAADAAPPPAQHVRRGHDRLDPFLGRDAAELDGFIPCARTIVDAREAVMMEVDHATPAYPTRCCGGVAVRRSSVS